jgi:hypothetical protein
LTSTQKASFIERVSDYPYVDRLGQTKTYTGSQLFKKLNNALQQAGLAGIQTCIAPVSLVGIQDVIFAITQAGPTIDMNSFVFIGGATAVPGDTTLVIYSTVVQGQGVTNPKETIFRQIGTVQEATVVTTINIQLMYETIYGDEWIQQSQLGNNIWFGFKLVSNLTGQAYTAMFMSKTAIEA